MTERSFFDSPSDDASDQQPDLHETFACKRRLVDLTHTLELDAVPDDLDSSPDDLPAHPEIIELIESLLAVNPGMQPAQDARRCEQPHVVYLPQNYEPTYAYPLVIWFHSDGGSEADLRRVMPQISDRNYIGVALRGNVASGTGYAWDLDESRIGTLIDDVRSVATSMRRAYHIHSERIYLAGFGSGATAAVEVMLRRPEWFGGVLSLNGDLPKLNQPLVGVEELKDKRILLATSLGSQSSKVGDVVAAGRMLYSAGMQVGTRVYQDADNAPSKKMLRDIDAWLMNDICTAVSA